MGFWFRQLWWSIKEVLATPVPVPRLPPWQDDSHRYELWETDLLSWDDAQTGKPGKKEDVK